MSPASMPADLEARRAWQAGQDALGLSVPVPAPERTNREPWSDGLKVPQGVAKLRDVAEREGWTVRLTYSVGPWLASRGAPIRQCIAVWCWKGEMFARATYISPTGRITWTYAGSIVKGGPAGMFSRCNVGEFMEYLTRGGITDRKWFAAITDRLEAAATGAKKKAASRPKKAREHA